MNERTTTYDWFAGILSYPNAERGIDIRFEICDNDKGSSPDAHLTPYISQQIEKFKKWIERLTIEEMEEVYTRTFDINPVASLEIGWHLYGEQYERGAFLVKMREILRTYQIEESVELPDHVTHVLLAFGRMEKPEADEFAVKYLLPALDKILEGFKDQKNPYENVLQSLKSFIEHHHVVGVPANE